MKTSKEQLIDYISNYSQETLMSERYTPASLMSSIVDVLGKSKGVFTELVESIKMPFGRPSFEIGKDSLNYDEYKKLLDNSHDKIKNIKYTSYNNLKIARIPSGIEMNYEFLLKEIHSISFINDEYFKQYEKLLGGIISKDPSVLNSSTAKLSEQLIKHNAVSNKRISNISKFGKDASKDITKVSTVVANAGQWGNVVNECENVYRTEYSVSYYKDRIEKLESLIDNAIAVLKESGDIKGSQMILSELSNSTLGLAQMVQNYAYKLGITIETLGCIHETMAAIYLSSENK